MREPSTVLRSTYVDLRVLEAPLGPRRDTRYTMHEEMVILGRLTSWTHEAIARCLGRTPRAIKDWCWRHGQNARNQHLVTSGQAARMLGCSCQWLTELARRGKIRARREPGGRWWLFDMGELERLVLEPAKRKARQSAARARWEKDRRRHVAA